MLNFKSFLKEANDGSVTKQSAHHVMAFGRMNPITHGHQAVVNKVHEVAKTHGATHLHLPDIIPLHKLRPERIRHCLLRQFLPPPPQMIHRKPHLR